MSHDHLWVMSKVLIKGTAKAAPEGHLCLGKLLLAQTLLF